jgi:16S rRNA (guanine527-N7)-methyltransferase
MRTKLESGLNHLRLDVADGVVENLLDYTGLLAEWSRSYNLVAPADRRFLLERHILDSLSVTPWLQTGALLDVGAGAGLPGIPLAIVKPEMDVTLVDSTGKKIRFMRHVKRSLGLGNVHPLQQRVEQMDAHAPFANIVSRAFSSLRNFAGAVRPLASGTTRLLAMKGVYPHDELEDLPDWVNLQSVERLLTPDLQVERHVVIMTVSMSDPTA